MRQDIRDTMESLADDGSREVVARIGATITDAEELRGLLENPSFQKVIRGIQDSMKTRLLECIEEDPDLRAMMNLLNQTIGVGNAAVKAEEVLQEIVTLAE